MDDQETIENEQAMKLRESRKNDAESEPETKVPAGSNVGKAEFGLMIGFTSFCDLVSQIPGVGFIIDGIAWFTIFVWTQTRGLKKPQIFHLSGAGGFIPFLPAYTGMVVFLYIYNENPQFRAFFGG